MFEKLKRIGKADNQTKQRNAGKKQVFYLICFRWLEDRSMAFALSFDKI